MNAWLPQASYPCGNFSDTSCLKLPKPKGSIGRAFTVCIRTENQNQVSFCPFAPRGVSVPSELTLGHLRYLLTDVPPQSNSPPDTVLGSDRPSPSRAVGALSLELRARLVPRPPPHRVSEGATQVVVFQLRFEGSHLCYTFRASSQSRTRVKLNRVFFPRCFCQARSLGCGFAR